MKTIADCYSIAENILAFEFDEFDHNPVMFVESMGWDSSKKDYKQAAKKLTYSREEVSQLANTIFQLHKKDTIDIVEDDEVQNFLTNCVAGKINDFFKRVV